MENALETKLNGEPVEACVNCIYFRRLPIDPTNIGAKPNGGICKRHPPIPIIMMIQTPNGDVRQQMQAFFPPVPDGELCGDFDNGIDEDGVED